MKRVHLETILIALFVVGSTAVMYGLLRSTVVFWNAQIFWNATLLLCWTIVAFGYYRQGWIVHRAKNSSHVSLLLPMVVFLVQCILFVKGVYYKDYAFIVGAVLVNSGVVFDIYQIILNRK